MPNDAQTLPVAPESLERRHEVSDRRVRNVLLVGGVAFFLVLSSLVVCGVLIRGLARNRPMQHMEPLGLVLAPNLRPLERFPQPTLDIDDDHAEMMALRARQDAELNSYGWIDRSNGVVRIPIERAMDLIAQRGLPARTNANSETDDSVLQLIQKIPEQR